MFNRIMVPLDGSRYSGRALRYAAEIGQRFSAEVILIQVVTPTITVGKHDRCCPRYRKPGCSENRCRSGTC